MTPIGADRLEVTAHGRVDVYPVGWCAVLIRTARMARHGLPRYAVTSSLRTEWRYTLRKVRRRDWRAVRCSLNGWLAEPQDWPDGLRRCGSGWTRRRALRDLERRIRGVR